MALSAELYDAIFKRKSFHLFRGVGDGAITQGELDGVAAAFAAFERLYPGIRLALRVVPAAKIGLRRDAEYCLLIYSEQKENYLMNAGYVGEQLDLYLVSRGIGTLWYGLGKPDEAVFDGLDYVIMFAIRKVGDETKFRRDMYAAKRKPLGEVWAGDGLGIADAVRYAPSSCNSQPWFVESGDGKLTVCRRGKPGRQGIMSEKAAAYFNRIDMGIFLCFIELCLQNNGIGFSRSLFPDAGAPELTKCAEYGIE